MQTQTFETSKGTLYVVDLPEGAKPVCLDKIRHFGSDSLLWLEMVNGSYEKRWHCLPSGDWQPLGLLKDISDLTASKIVDYKRLTVGIAFMDYSGKKPMASTALESLQSLLETEICLKNPQGQEPVCDCNYTCGEADRYNCGYEHHQWQSAESQVWRNPFLMFKTK